MRMSLSEVIAKKVNKDSEYEIELINKLSTCLLEDNPSKARIYKGLSIIGEIISINYNKILTYNKIINKVFDYCMSSESVETYQVLLNSAIQKIEYYTNKKEKIKREYDVIY